VCFSFAAFFITPPFWRGVESSRLLNKGILKQKQRAWDSPHALSLFRHGVGVDRKTRPQAKSGAAILAASNSDPFLVIVPGLCLTTKIKNKE